MEIGNASSGLDPMSLTFRRAECSDVPAVGAPLSDDLLGASRELAGEKPLEAHLPAFDEITGVLRLASPHA